MTTSETLIINGAKEEIEAIREAISSQPGSQCHVSERRNLDGNTAAWIVIANLAAQAVPHVLGFLKEYLATKHVKKIKLGDLEIENPTPQDVERFRALIDAKMKK